MKSINFEKIFGVLAVVLAVLFFCLCSIGIVIRCESLFLGGVSCILLFVLSFFAYVILSEKTKK